MNAFTDTPPSISDAMWSFDLTENRFSYISPLLSDLFNVSHTEIESSPFFWARYIHPDDYTYVFKELKKGYLATYVEIEYRICVGSQIKWVKDRRFVHLNREGKRTAISGLVSDTTITKEDSINPSDLETNFKYLFINNPNPLWIYDTVTLQFLDVNNAAISKYGYSKEEFLSMTIADVRPPEDVDALIKSVKGVKGQYTNPSQVWRHLKKNSEIIFVNISGHGVRYRGREAEIVMAHDVTVQVKSEREITVAKESLDALINNIEDQIWSIDNNYRILSANIHFKRTIARMIGRELKYGESVFFRELMGKDAEVWRSHYDRALKGETFQIMELSSYPEKTPFFSETKFNPIRINGKIAGVACTSRNIQERLETQKRIVEQNAKLLELISIVSHEIRGPIASIMGLTNIFNNKDYHDPFNAEVIQLIQNLTSELDKLLYTLIDKTYDLQQTNELNAPFNKVDQ